MFQPRRSITPQYFGHGTTSRHRYSPYPSIAASNSGAARSRVPSGISPDLVESQERTRRLGRDLIAVRTRLVDHMRRSTPGNSPRRLQRSLAPTRTPNLDAMVPRCSRPCGHAHYGESADQPRQEDVYRLARRTAQQVLNRRPQVLVSKKDPLISAWERKRLELFEEQEVEMIRDLQVVPSRYEVRATNIEAFRSGGGELNVARRAFDVVRMALGHIF